MERGRLGRRERDGWERIELIKIVIERSERQM